MKNEYKVMSYDTMPWADDFDKSFNIVKVIKAKAKKFVFNKEIINSIIREKVLKKDFERAMEKDPEKITTSEYEEFQRSKKQTKL